MKNKGFTLLELLIVIIIIGLLASIGIVQYTKAISNAKNTQAKAVLGEMRKAVLAYKSVASTGTAPTLALIASVDLDGDGVADVTFSPPASPDFTYTVDSTTQGSAQKQANAGGGVTSWHINFDTGALTSY